MSVPRVAEIAPEDLTPEQSRIVEAAKAGRGFVPRPFKIWLHRPQLADVIESFGTYVNAKSSLSKRELEIAVVLVAKRINAEYVIAAHLRMAANAGHPPEVVEALSAGREPQLASERERVVYEIAHAFDDPVPLSDERFAHAVEVLGRDGIADLCALIGYYTAVSTAMKLHKVPAE